MDLAGILLETPMFGGLGHGDVDELLLHLTELRYDAGESVWIEGDPAAAIYVIAEGALKSHRLSREGGEEVIPRLPRRGRGHGRNGLFRASRFRRSS